MSTTRRPRWHPPPPPSPRIIHLPRRTRRKTTKKVTGKQFSGRELEGRTRNNSQRGKLESLFDQERAFARSVPIVLINSGGSERRERVKDLDFRDNSINGLKAEFVEDEQQHWRFQAEILRAECNFLRMEREIALKKLELNRVQTKRTLKSAVETLHSGKSKICEGKRADVVLEEEIRDLEEKLNELQRCCSSGIRDFEVRMCSSSNFDKQACVLQRRLEKLGETICEEKCVKEIREIAEASLSIKENRCKDVEILRRKMERLSKGMLERMEEEYGSMLVSSSSSTTTTTSASASANSSASSSMRIEFHHPPLSSAIVPQIHLQEAMWHEENNNNNNNNKGCSGRCKSIVRKIVEQVRAETEEWSQMQQMVERVKEEMEELQAFRDFWKNKALDSDGRLQSLKSNVKEWKQRARASETKVTELEKQISGLHIEIERLKTQKKSESTKTTAIMQTTTTRDYSLKEKEKRVLICSLKENNNHSNKGINNGNIVEGHHGRHRVSRSRRASPLQEIGNLSPVLQKKSNSRALFPLHYSEVSHLVSGSICSINEGSIE